MTVDDLDERVEQALARLSARDDDDARLERDRDDKILAATADVLRDRYDVRSSLTGATVIIDVGSDVAREEADRLNQETHRPVGVVNGRSLRAGEHRGQVTEYVVYHDRVRDADATLEQSALRLSELADRADRDGDGQLAERARATSESLHPASGEEDGEDA